MSVRVCLMSMYEFMLREVLNMSFVLFTLDALRVFVCQPDPMLLRGSQCNSIRARHTVGYMISRERRSSALHTLYETLPGATERPE